MEKKRLEDEFVSACHDVSSLQTEQIAAVIAGDVDFTRFDDLLHLAREKKDDAKYALLLHIEEHRC